MEKALTDNGRFINTWKTSKNIMVNKYKNLLAKHGDDLKSIQMSQDGQLFRFKKLLEIGDLNGKSILDIGCGRADLYDYLRHEIKDFKYTGIDIVPELTKVAQSKYPDANIHCRDILEDPIDDTFDYIFISMVINNNIPNMEVFAKQLLNVAFKMANVGLGFNFVSSYVNHKNPNGINHDPVEMFDFCLNELSKQVTISHHYQRCDVSVFVYK